MTTSSATILEGDAARIDINNPRVGDLFAKAPAVMFFHVRDTVGAIMGSHRREFLARTEVKFKGGGMRVGNITGRASLSSGPATSWDVRRSFIYEVSPVDKVPPPGVTPDLAQIAAASATTSPAALGLEKGGTFPPREGRYQALPIGITLDSLGRVKGKWTSPTRFLQGKQKKELVAVRKLAGPGRQPNLVLYWKKKTGRGKGRKEVLLPAFLLVPRVTRKQRLKYLETWKNLEANRGERLRAMLDRAAKEMQNG